MASEDPVSRPRTDGRGPYHPRTHRHRVRLRGGLRLRDAVAMAIGGMIGGGIFSVLGVTIDLAGHLAFACFVVAGVIALLTAHSYAALTLRAGTSGGPYTYLRDAGHLRLAGIASWYLIVGYILALSVYAFTFGHYLSELVNGGDVVARLAVAGVLVFFWAVNAHGVGASSLTEDAVVGAKLLILAVVAGIGLFAWSGPRLTPLANEGSLGVFAGAAAIFVAYEGFELLSYDYDDIENPERTLPRALYVSVIAVIAIYVLVTLGSQMLVADDLIVAQREAAFAAVGQEALGTAGRWLATAAALLATSSAINATLFSTARMVRDLGDAHEVPAVIGRTKNGLPTTAMWLLAAAGAMFAMLPGIEQLLAFGSITFLAVFGLINYLHARTTRTRREVVLGALGAAGCGAAIVVMVARLAANDPATLVFIAVCLAVVGAARLVFRHGAVEPAGGDSPRRE